MFLITRPNHDDIVNYLSIWSKELIDLATKKGKKVIDITYKKPFRLANLNKPINLPNKLLINLFSVIYKTIVSFIFLKSLSIVSSF